MAFRVRTLEDGIEHEPHFGGGFARGDGAEKLCVGAGLLECNQVVLAKQFVSLVEFPQDEAGGIGGALAKASRKPTGKARWWNSL